jgi:hypothetical protein
MNKNVLIYYLGISELLAITIGVAITIAIGVMLYMFMPNLLSSTTQQQKLGFMIISANAINDRSALISMTLRNLGTKAINNVNITILSQDINITNILTPQINSYLNKNRVQFNLSANPLTSGQEMSVVMVVEGKSLISGSKINIIAIVKYVDGTTSATSTTAIII